MHALTAFARVLPADTYGMEVHICEDGSGSITALTGNKRTVSLSFEMGPPDGRVYDYRLMGTPEYIVYEPPALDGLPETQWG